MQTLLVDILADGLKIGTAKIGPSDRSMGVASGVFHPNNAYKAEAHARQSETFERSTTPIVLRARDGRGIEIECAGIDLVDFSQTIGVEGRELHVLGIDEYVAYFGHDDG